MVGLQMSRPQHVGYMVLILTSSTVKQDIQCRSEISEPKYARKTRIICVFVYTHTSIDIYAYAYILIRVCLISMYEVACCFFFCGKVIVDFNGHCICSENWWSRLHRMSVERRLSCVYSGCLLTAVEH